MLTIVALTLILIMTIADAQAQKPIRLGLRGGLNIATMGGDATEGSDISTRTGFMFGGFGIIDVSDVISIQPELRFSTKGAKQTYNASDFLSLGVAQDFEEKVKLTYLEVPVLVKFRIPTQGKIKPNVVIGPSIQFNLSAKDEETFDDTFLGKRAAAQITEEFDINNMKSVLFGGVFGAGITIPLQGVELNFDVRYSLDFGTAFDDVDNLDDVPDDEAVFIEDSSGKAVDLKSRVFSIEVGATWPIR